MDFVSETPALDDDDPDFISITCPDCGFIFYMPLHIVKTGNFECQECGTILGEV